MFGDGVEYEFGFFEYFFGNLGEVFVVVFVGVF